jgi:hypothetical protein
VGLDALVDEAPRLTARASRKSPIKDTTAMIEKIKIWSNAPADVPHEEIEARANAIIEIHGEIDEHIDEALERYGLDGVAQKISLLMSMLSLEVVNNFTPEEGAQVLQDLANGFAAGFGIDGADGAAH